MRLFFLTLLCCGACFSLFSLEYLSEQQLTDYQRDGFLILENFVSGKDCESLRQRALEIVRAEGPQAAKEIFTTMNQGKSQDQFFLESGSKICLFFEPKAFDDQGELIVSLEHAVNKISHALHDLDPAFSFFSRLPQIQKLVADLGIAHPLLLQSMYIFKQPHIGGEVTCHQDGTFLFTEPDTTLGLWFALEDARLDNGCLWVIPGGHTTSLKSRFLRTKGNGTRFEIYDDSPWNLELMIPLEVKKGSLIVLHSRVPHMSYTNTSTQSRHAYTLHIIDGQSAYPADNWLQRPANFPAQGF
jgi:phytanoyl-CoA hydroxylase